MKEGVEEVMVLAMRCISEVPLDDLRLNSWGAGEMRGISARGGLTLRMLSLSPFLQLLPRRARTGNRVGIVSHECSLHSRSNLSFHRTSRQIGIIFDAAYAAICRAVQS